MKIIYSVSGMTCQHCSARVKDALLKHPDVHSARADHQNSSAEVEAHKEPPIEELNSLIGQQGDYRITGVISQGGDELSGKGAASKPTPPSSVRQSQPLKNHGPQKEFLKEDQRRSGEGNQEGEDPDPKKRSLSSSGGSHDARQHHHADEEHGKHQHSGTGHKPEKNEQSHQHHGEHKGHGHHGEHKGHEHHGEHKGHKHHGEHKGHEHHGEHKGHKHHGEHKGHKHHGEHKGHEHHQGDHARGHQHHSGRQPEGHDDQHSRHGLHEHHSGHEHQGHHGHMLEDFRRRFWISLLLTIPIVVLAPMVQHMLGYELRFPGDHWVQFALSSIVFFYGGWPFLYGMVLEIRDRAPGMMTLIALAISVAYVYSSAVVFGLEGEMFFWELATLVTIMLLGHWIEMKSVMSASSALDELAKLMPSEALRINQQGETEVVSISELKQGDLILVKPGEKIPADGKIREGESHINEAMLTGESLPVSKKQGEQVIGGSINQEGTLKLEVVHTGEESYLSRVIAMVDQAQKSKSKTQNLANKAAGWLFYIALFAGFLTLTVWLLLGREFVYALERMVTVMVISCPHALGLAVPLVVAISTTVAAQKGLLIRNRTAFENARSITTILFDKTGTLTRGKFGVTRYKSTSNQLQDEEVISMAASLEYGSEHPIAAGILAKARDMGLKFEEARDFKTIRGKGIQAYLGGRKLGIMSPGSLKEKGISIPEEASAGKTETVVFLLVDDQLAGYIALADEIRPESADAIRVLKERGIKVAMATGDNQQVAQSVAAALELDDYYAQVLPEDKQKIISQLQEKGEFVAMTGDGINDAPALAQANVGIAVGSGTDVAAETADIVLVNSNPSDIASLILFGAATYRKMVQNLFWAVGYNVVAIPLAAGVLAWAGIVLSPAMGAVLMSVSTIIVAINAQLLKKQIRQ